MAASALRATTMLMGIVGLGGTLAPRVARAAAGAGGAAFSTASLPPAHYAFPVHDLEAAREFYGGLLGLPEGRSAKSWIDFNMFGHQIVAHFTSSSYRHDDHFNPVDGDEVPVAHFGAALTVDDFQALAARLKAAGVKFVIEPHLRFEGEPGEQYTMFFKDPSGNNLEFKAMTNPDNLFAKFDVDAHEASKAAGKGKPEL